MTDRKYCEDCQFCFVPSNGVQFARCTNQGAIKKLGADGGFMVSRQLDIDSHRYAASSRMDNEMCGPEAKWFAVKTDEAAA